MIWLLNYKNMIVHNTKKHFSLSFIEKRTYSYEVKQINIFTLISCELDIYFAQKSDLQSKQWLYDYIKMISN